MIFFVFKNLQLQEKRTFLQDMKKINSRSTADISYVKEKWLAFTSHLKAIFFFCIKICHTKILNILLKCLVYIMVSLLSTGTVIQKFFSVGFSDMINIQVFYKLNPEKHCLPARQF